MASPAPTADITLQIRVPSDHPVITDEPILAEVKIGSHSFTLEWQPPLRPLGERLYQADYSDDHGE